VVRVDDIGQIGTITLILRRCNVGGMAEDQTNRGCIPDNVNPPIVAGITNMDDSLTHRAEYFLPFN
jgi:hypothetical protein